MVPDDNAIRVLAVQRPESGLLAYEASLSLAVMAKEKAHSVRNKAQGSCRVQEAIQSLPSGP